jgi:hypothetical protein
MSKSLLQQLYDGEIYPAEQIVPKSPEYKELLRKLSAEKEYLREKLSESDRERFDEIGSMYLEIASLCSYEDFAYGFRLGVGLMIEVLVHENGLSHDDE